MVFRESQKTEVFKYIRNPSIPITVIALIRMSGMIRDAETTLPISEVKVAISFALPTLSSVLIGAFKILSYNAILMLAVKSKDILLKMTCDIVRDMRMNRHREKNKTAYLIFDISIPAIL